MGKSFRTGRPVLQDALPPFLYTLKLSVVSLAFAGLLGIGLGVLAGVRPHSLVSGLVMVLALLGVSIASGWPSCSSMSSR